MIAGMSGPLKAGRVGHPNALEGQHAHSVRTYATRPDFLDATASEPAQQAAQQFHTHGVRELLELGPGQGRLSALFADLRGSTGIAEQVGATAFGVILNCFYAAVNASVDAADGVLDKYVGDGAIGLFFRGISGDAHAARAIDAGQGLLAITRGDVEGVPVGVGVHTGEAFVWVVGMAGGPLDFTAVGDTINTTSRLASAAGPGELLVSSVAATAASLATADLERRYLEVRGRTEPVEVVVVREVGGLG